MPKIDTFPPKRKTSPTKSRDHCHNSEHLTEGGSLSWDGEQYSKAEGAPPFRVAGVLLIFLQCQ